ncbi:MAG: Lrp/AsnC family transcriptional regulator [Oscillospiraceae bacterium]|nr:Lrp/AsnC family transcriptional regulator [Oscillospiraceae bacterium]
MDQLLSLLNENARFSSKQLAAMLGTTAEEVEKQIASYEKQGIIRGYKVLLDHERLDEETVQAIIEVKVSPKRDLGFEDIARRIMSYSEVDTVYLMSGGYDLLVILECRTFKDIALFVQQRLAALDSVLSTATHFVLVRYKEKGVVLCGEDSDDRRSALL